MPMLALTDLCGLLVRSKDETLVHAHDSRRDDESGLLHPGEIHAIFKSGLRSCDHSTRARNSGRALPRPSPLAIHGLPDCHEISPMRSSNMKGNEANRSGGAKPCIQSVVITRQASASPPYTNYPGPTGGYLPGSRAYTASYMTSPCDGVRCRRRRCSVMTSLPSRSSPGASNWCVQVQPPC